MKSPDSDQRPDPARVEELFHAATDLPATEHAAFLAHACGEDEILANAVRSLLAAGGDAATAWNRTALQIEARHSAFDSRPAQPGEFFGPYRIKQVIAAGGMSFVYEAHRDDDEFHKRVAIKFVHQEIGDSGRAESFRTERQILAGLEHPCIARLLDGGTTSTGVPYLVMEYVDGVPIDRFAAENRLSISERLHLFLRVCEAVQYAHRHLVIHRDLKPGNILVNADSIPKLLDFGIAKVLTAGGASTGSATVVAAMTPDYASPEQLAGRTVTTASDVYSLGVVLYELLSGARAFNHAGLSWSDILEQRERPLRPGLSQDLNSIVLKATAFDPAERYGSPRELASDIENFLGGLPVIARPPSSLYHFLKFVRRRRWAVAASATALTMVLGSAVVAQMERARAEERFQQVRKLARSMVFELHDKIAPLNGSTEARQFLVTRAVEYLESLAKQARDDSSLLVELAGSYRRIASVLGQPGEPNLGDLPGALRNIDRSIAIARHAVALRPRELDPRRELFRSLNLRGILLEALMRLPEGKHAREEAGATIRQIVASPQATFQDQTDYAALLFQEAMAIADLGVRISAEQDLVHRYESLFAQHPEDSQMRRDIALMEKYLGSSLVQTGRVEESLPHKQRAVAIDSELVERYPERREHQVDLRNSLRNLASSLEKLRRAAEADPLYRRSVEISRRLVTADTQDRSAPLGLAWDLSAYCGNLDDMGAYLAALRSCLEGLSVVEVGIAERPSRYAYYISGRNLYNLGRIAEHRHHPVEACSWYERAAGTIREIEADPANPYAGDETEDWRKSAAKCRSGRD